MFIEGKRDIYKVKWRRLGISFGEPIVLVKGPILFGLMNGWIVEWVGSNTRSNPEKMHPHELRSWYERTVEDYEKYQDAWDEENKKENLL